MMRIIYFILLLSITATARPQAIATLAVDLSRRMSGIAAPASIDLDSLTDLPVSSLGLVLRTGGTIDFTVPFQVDTVTGRRILHWIVDPFETKDVSYLLIRSQDPEIHPPDPFPLSALAANGELAIAQGQHKRLTYVYKTTYPPPGIDTAFKKSGFIHPLYTPQGQILTRIQPPDHYHHYGIWDPWTHILYKGDTIDCWNLAVRKGTQRFAKFSSIISGPVFAQYQALQQHVAFHKDGTEEVFLNELQTARIYHSDSNYYLLDITIELTPATSYPVTLLAYRYGGLGWRATPEWNRDNSEVLTSEGKDRRHSDNTKARWCIVQGSLGAYGGAAMLSSPSNFNHPEPLRIWPDSSNGRGDLFANFSPTKDSNWLLEPGHTYTLHYRWVVFNGHFTKEQAESAWQYFSNPPHINTKPS
jgi:hypothetical protein